MAEKLDEQSNLTLSEGKILLRRTERLESTIGKRVSGSGHGGSQLPTVWASLAFLSGRLDETIETIAKEVDSWIVDIKVSEASENLKAHCAQELTKTLGDAIEKITQVQETVTQKVTAKLNVTDSHILSLARGAAKMKDEISTLGSRSNFAVTGSVSVAMLRSVETSIKAELSDLTTRLVSVSSELHRMSCAHPATGGPGDVENTLNELREMFAALASRVNKLVTDSDNEAVKFHSLDSWL
jgi:hypothetical protein